METKSFSNTTKHELINNNDKVKKCCMFSLLYGFLYCTEDKNGYLVLKKTNVENAELLKKTLSFLLKNKNFIVSENNTKILINKEILKFSTVAEYKNNIFKCSNCINHFLKAIFLINGTVNDPLKSYRLEFVFSNENKRNEISNLLMECGFSSRTSKRGKNYIIYIKDSFMIEDFFAKIGAPNATFEIMNSKILKEIRNNANRVANCDSANISKSINASKKYIDAIEELSKKGKLDLLPKSLQETAKLRLEYKELNYAQLGEKFNKPVSKSGIFHRLERIYEFYIRIKNEL